MNSETWPRLYQPDFEDCMYFIKPRTFVFWVWAPPFNRYSARSKDKTSAASVDSVTPCWTQLNQLAESPTGESTKMCTCKKQCFAVKICKRALSHHWKYSTKMCTCKNDVFDAKICKRALVASTEGYLAVAVSTPTGCWLLAVGNNDNLKWKHL